MKDGLGLAFSESRGPGSLGTMKSWGVVGSGAEEGGMVGRLPPSSHSVIPSLAGSAHSFAEKNLKGYAKRWLI